MRRVDPSATHGSRRAGLTSASWPRYARGDALDEEKPSRQGERGGAAPGRSRSGRSGDIQSGSQTRATVRMAPAHTLLARPVGEAGQEGGRRRVARYTEALDIALAWRWIDAQKRGCALLVAERFTPRGTRSLGSTINARGAGDPRRRQMKAPGWRVGAPARRRGRRPRPASRAAVPDDPGGRPVGGATGARVLRNLHATTATRSCTGRDRRDRDRARRIAKYVAMLARGRDTLLTDQRAPLMRATRARGSGRTRSGWPARAAGRGSNPWRAGWRRPHRGRRSRWRARARDR